jgi:beta-propeller repeat-containing protein
MSTIPRSRVWLLIAALALTAAEQRGSAAAPPSGAAPDARRALVNLPLAFVENRGSADARVRFFAQGPRYGFYLTQREVVLAFLNESATGEHALAMRFVGANPGAAISGAGNRSTFNDFHGSDPSRWRTNVPAYSTIVYRALWPHVDLHVRGAGGTLKYEFHVAPGAAPEAIRLAYDGASSLAVDAAGALIIGTGMGALRDAPPASYQTIDGARVPVESRYALDARGGDREVGFALGAYRHDRELVIDPGIAFTTFLGGSSHEIPGGTAVDANGNVYVTGFTQSPDFPTTVGALKRTGAAQNSVETFVTKINPTGTALVYSTFIGGSDFDWGRRIAVDGAGNAYVAGQTKSGDFPTTAGAFDRALAIPPNCPRCFADNYDAFVLKLNATGSALVYSTYLGGTDIDDARGIAVDSAGNAYVTGETVSLDFPTTAGSFQPASKGSYDVFVTKVNPTGSGLVYSTFLGGSAVDDGERIAVDASGRAVVLGFSSSADFPTTAGAYDTTPNGDFDVTITKLNAAGSALVFSTLLGGSASDSGGGLALDAAGNIYVSGGTASLNFPTTPGAFDTTPDGSDAFVAKFDAAGSRLLWSTVIGGASGGEGASGVAVDAGGNVWIAGGTSSTDFPVTANAPQRTFKGVNDAFIAEITADGASLAFSTFLGGRDSDNGDDIAIDPAGKVIVVGHTYSLDFPATSGAFDTVFNGDPSIFWGDAFVTKIDPTATTSAPPADAPVPAAPALLSPPNGDAPPQPITFDWSDVAGAASYTIQIDDSSAFSAPLVRNAAVTSSMYATSGLNTVTHFWRVRGVNVNGVAGAWSAVRSFTPQAAPPPATLSTMDTNPSTVVGGNASSTTVVLSTGAPFGGATIGLSSSNPQVASVPPTVTVPENGFTGTATITTSPVSTNTSVTITASYNGTTRTAVLMVTNGSTSATLQSLALSPSTVAGGNPAQGVVTLSSAAPAGGAVVGLSSDSAAVAAVPASVTVAPGATNAVFNISTTAVSASTPVTISASYAGTTRSATLSVTPAAPPPQTATLTLTVTGRSGVHVTTTPTGLDVVSGSTGSAAFSVGTSITLRVGSGREAIFSGACATSKSTSCTFTINGAASVTANVQ